MEEYYKKQNKILDEKIKLKSQAINNELNERFGYLEEKRKKCEEKNNNYMKIQYERLKQEKRTRKKEGRKEKII